MLRISDMPVPTLYQLGMDAYQLGNLELAQRYWDQGLSKASQNASMSSWSGAFLAGLANVHENLGNHGFAIDLARQALEIAEASSDQRLKAETHVTLARAYLQTGNYPAAKHHSELARTIAKRIGNLKLESDSTRNLGAIYKNQGEFNRAENYYQTAMTLASQAEDLLLQAKALNNLGELSQRRGQYTEALKFYEQSLQLRQKTEDLAGQGNVLGNLCRIYRDLNEYEQALLFCKRALIISRKTHTKAYEANHLNNIAEIYWRLGEFKRAKKYFIQSIEIKQTLGDRDGEARAWNNLAVILKSEGKYEKALDSFFKSLNIKQQIKDISGQSATYYNIGLTYTDLDRYNDALEYLKHALLIQAELNEAGLLWRIYGKLSDIHKHLNHPDLAVFFGKLAVNHIQSLRAENLALNKHLQKSFLEDKRVIYENLANLLIDQGRFPEAQQVLAMLKEEEYFDFIQRQETLEGNSTKATYTRTESDYATRYHQLTSGLIEQRNTYTQLSKKKESGQILTQTETQRFNELNAALEEARTVYLEFLNELEQAFAEERHLKEFYARDLDEINQTQYLLSKFENTVLVYYLYTDEKLRILLVDSNLSFSPTLYEQPINRPELNHLIHAFREALSRRNDPLIFAEKLFKLLIEPIQADLDLLQPETLLIYPARSLRYLPFSALFDGERYLIEQYAITMYNAAAQSYLLLEKPRDHWSIAGFGISESLDPVFNDLPAVEDEINAIVKEKIADEIGILPGSAYLNQEFTPDQLIQVLKQRDAYQVIHLATHFKFTPGSPISSFLLAGKGAHISLQDLLQGDYQMAGKDLVTLSACETALGELDDPKRDGKELEGLGTLIQRKGAHAVLATLWPVADQSTAVFMAQFYTLREQKNISKAEAIRQTQRLFIQGNVIMDETNRKARLRGISLPADEIAEPQFEHPYFWAPFILMGNWQ
ncbi:CHAT domain-containing protein [Nitrosomonas marina]|uniref:CHAT domain-containing protein n=1 Tax=Nitrosomonas marina TaxID=917 RepID=A0A1H9Y3W6_9PROT|nr:tetratricopeptide repeat protein [Nitrosomonas marina]SES63515.1 CHAT domain-containing protein [Nitrosomonas marina]